MTIAELCILIACLLPVVCVGIAKWKGIGVSRQDGGYDNHNPRGWLAGLEGWQARANAAQHNSFEALPIFIAGVLIAQAHGAASSTVDALAVVFVLARVAYIAAYLGNLPPLRSLCWASAMVCTGLLYLEGLKAALAAAA
jgi:uncharacterized MAPEG superfamily protein